MKLKKHQRNQGYKKFLELLLRKPHEQNFFCCYVRDKYKLRSNSSHICEPYFPEYFLFKEQDNTAWLNHQTQLHYVNGNIDFELNQYRVFITQLCIEMTK